MKQKHVLIIGATSAIAEETARRFAERGDAVFLAARRADRLSVIADDLRSRGAAYTGWAVLDINDIAAHTALLDAATAALGGLDTVLIAHGTLPDQRACQASVALTITEFTTNAVSTLAVLTAVADRFETQRFGIIAVIGSVAGDRGRQSNYVYGAAKGAVETFAQGLRNRMARAGVQVLLVKPGFVDTPMTATFGKGPLWTSPGIVARGILRAIDRKADVVYLPGFWRWIMLAIRMIPERVFKRMSL